MNDFIYKFDIFDKDKLLKESLAFNYETQTLIHISTGSFQKNLICSSSKKNIANLLDGLIPNILGKHLK